MHKASMAAFHGFSTQKSFINYDSSLQQKIRFTEEIKTELATAIENDLFELAFQHGNGGL